jgi:glycosyltransferase involved in cell wall biosynthesis
MRMEKQRALVPSVLCVGGEDHDLRIPFLLRLHDHGFRVIAAGTGRSDPFARAGLEYHHYRFDRFANPLADWHAIGRLAKLLTDVQPDLVQTFDTKPNVLVPLAARRAFEKVLLVRTINGMGWLYSSRSPMALGLRPVYQALQAVAASSSAATVFQNRADQAFFERRRMTGSSPSRLIPGSGIDIERFERAQAAGPPPERLREALGLGASEVVITVTRLTRQKGISTLLAAAALVHQIRPGVRFLLVGPRQSEGPFAIAQAEIDRHAPYVMALGRRSDVPALLGLANVFAFPTEYREGVPRVLLEAALARLPIVTTNMPGCSDVVTDGRTGFLVPPRSPSALAARIIDLLRDREQAEAMGRHAASFVAQEFNLGLTVARYAALYSELLERRDRKTVTDPARESTSREWMTEGDAAARREELVG